MYVCMYVCIRGKKDETKENKKKKEKRRHIIRNQHIHLASYLPTQPFIILNARCIISEIPKALKSDFTFNCNTSHSSKLENAFSLGNVLQKPFFVCNFVCNQRKERICQKNSSSILHIIRHLKSMWSPLHMQYEKKYDYICDVLL